MPTQFILLKWLCDYCAEMYDAEIECILHERDTHAQHKNALGLDVLTALKQICQQMENEQITDYEHLNMYEQRLRAMHETAIKMKQSSLVAKYQVAETRPTEEQARFEKSFILPDEPAVMTIEVEDNEVHNERSPLRNDEKVGKEKPESRPTKCQDQIISKINAVQKNRTAELDVKSITSYKHSNSHRDTFRRREPNHMCEQCGKKFRLLHDLIKHERTHDNNRPYACTHCDKTFTQKGNLQRHERLVHATHDTLINTRHSGIVQT
jgi:hypothetical protein